MHRTAIGLLLLLLAAGCSYTRRVGKESPHAGDYVPGQVYVLQQDAVLVDRHAETSPTSTYYFWRSVPGKFVKSPRDAERCDVEPKNRHPLPAGTRLRFDELIYHNYFENETTYPFAVVLNGPLKGERVSIADVSRRDSNLRYLRDPAWLQPLDADRR